MTTERFRSSLVSEKSSSPLSRRVHELMQAEAMMTSGLGSRPAGEDFEDAPPGENPYAEGDVLARLGDDAADAHEEAQTRHAAQSAPNAVSTLPLKAAPTKEHGAEEETSEETP